MAMSDGKIAPRDFDDEGLVVEASDEASDEGSIVDEAESDEEGTIA